MRIGHAKVGMFAAAGLLVMAGASAAPQAARKASPARAGRAQATPIVRVRPVQSPTMPTPGHLALVGITRIGDRSQAWLVNRNTRARATVAPGQTVFGFQVKQIDPERVVFTQNGRQFSLRLGENPEPQSLVAGYQSELRSNGANTGALDAAPSSEGVTLPVSPENRAPAPGGTTIVEVNPVTEVRQVPAPAAGAPMASPTFDPALAGSTFYPGFGAGYPGFVPLYPEEAVVYPGTVTGGTPYGTVPGGISPYAPGVYTAAPYPLTPYPAAPSIMLPYATAPYALPPTLDQGFYPGEGITRGRFSGNFPGYGPFAPPYPSGQPRGVYSSDWPQDLRFIPLQRGNPQTFRRRSGDYGGEGYSNNPQTRRRRDYYGR